eukprot:GHVL01012674.1.p2 GENE.GHVL01012674.1~~GHVL01012674.1.p2  ORF type:complete len:178 (-),score=10.29 GHVL01012674.1:584-1117(-)
MDASGPGACLKVNAVWYPIVVFKGGFPLAPFGLATEGLGAISVSIFPDARRFLETPDVAFPTLGTGREATVEEGDSALVGLISLGGLWLPDQLVWIVPVCQMTGGRCLDHGATCRVVHHSFSRPFTAEQPFQTHVSSVSSRPLLGFLSPSPWFPLALSLVQDDNDLLSSGQFVGNGA